MSRPPLHALQGFVAAARAGNLSRAAVTQHLTVSALSHQIKALESRLGQALFVRGSRGITLTDDGRRLLDRIEPHLDAIDAALRPFAARREDVLTLSVGPSMASAWLVPRLGPFLAAHPQLEFNLQSDWALVDFDRDRPVDAALRTGTGRWPGVTVEHLFDEVLMPVASPALIAQRGLPTADTLHEWPLLGDPGGYWERWFAEGGRPPPTRFVARFDDAEALHRAAVAGVGIGLARLTRAALLIDGGLLVPVTGRPLRSEYAHYLVYPPRSHDHTGLLAFRDWVHDQARAYVAGSAHGAMGASA